MRAPDAVRLLGELIVPPRCATCAAPAARAALLCPACARSLANVCPGSAIVPGVGTVTWALRYEGTARALVAALKFRGSLGLARVAGAAVAAVLPALEGWTVVAVPAAPARRRRRGFDPAESIAGEVAAGSTLERAAPLARADGPRQVGRRRADRLGAPPRVRAIAAVPARVLLVDDVLTTGATLAACAAALRAAGCAEVRGAVFARALGYPRASA